MLQTVEPLTIVIPTYNGVRYIEEAIESVRCQTLTHWRLIVVDDGSKDETPALVAEIAEREPRLQLIQQKNGGIAAARNRGFAAIPDPQRGAVLFFDHDDRLTPDALEQLSLALAKNPPAPAAHGLPTLISGSGTLIEGRDGFTGIYRKRSTVQNGRIVSLEPDAPTDWGAIALKCWIHSAGLVLIRCSAFSALDGFDSSTCPADDYDFYLRLTRQWGALAFTPTLTLEYRMHDSNTSHRKASNMAFAEKQVWVNQLLQAEAHSPHEKQELIQAYRASLRYMAREKAEYALNHLRQGDLRGFGTNLLRSGRRWVDSMGALPR